MTVLELGGPRKTAPQTCSALQVRRLLAGELSVDDSVTVEQHLESCARCRAVRAEVQAEQRLLEEALPFEAFAAGVAEKLARTEAREAAVRLPLRSWTLLTVAGSFAAAAAVVLIAVRAPSGGGEERVTRPGAVDGRGTRSKGGASVSVFAVRAARTFALRENEPSEPGDRLLPSLSPNGHTFALVALVEPGEVSVLFKGPARAGPLPEAFEWTGAAHTAQLAAVYSDAPLDEGAVVAALKSNTVAALPGAEVVFHALQRPAAH